MRGGRAGVESRFSAGINLVPPLAVGTIPTVGDGTGGFFTAPALGPPSGMSRSFAALAVGPAGFAFSLSNKLAFIAATAEFVLAGLTTK